MLLPSPSRIPAHALARALGLVLLCGCGTSMENVTPPAPPAPPIAISTVVVVPDAATAQVGRTLQLTAQTRDVNGAALLGRTISWTTDNTALASVSGTGLVTAIAGDGPVIISATSEGKVGSARITVVYPSRDSIVARAGVETVLRIGGGAEVRFAAGALPPGTTVEMLPVAGRLGTAGAPIGSPISVSVRYPPSAVASLSVTSEPSFIPFSLTLTGTSSLSAEEGRFQLLGFAQGLPSMPVGATIPLVPTSAIATPGVSGSLSASFLLGTTANSTPAFISTQLVELPAGCSQGELPDSRRFQRVRHASPEVAGIVPIVLVLVHGWQLDQFTCKNASDYDYLREPTWKGFIDALAPKDAVGTEPRARQYEVWSYQYLTASSFATIGVDLARLLNAMPRMNTTNRKFVIVAHSKGGLVSAAAMLSPSAPTVLGLITAGTPWNGTPMGGAGGTVGQFMHVGCYLRRPTNFLLNLMDFPVCSTFANWSAGARDLGTANDGEIARRITTRRSELTGRITAIGSSLTFSPRYSSAIYLEFLSAHLAVVSGENDGLVPLSSSRPADLGSLGGTPLRGFDHSGYLSVTPPGVSPTGQSQIIEALNNLLDKFAPVNSVSVLPLTLSLTVGETRQFSAIPRDVAGGALPGRIVTWNSSDSNVADVSPTGLATGKTGSAQPVTITAQSEGKSASAQVTVAIPVTGEWRAILTWGGAPNDLDSHLTGPTATGGRFWINYANIGNCSVAPFACLDEDVSNAGGPETIRISRSMPAGSYSYSVHNFSAGNSATNTTLSQSNARVALYRGSVLTQVFPVPSAAGTLWTVFEIESGVVRLVNTMSGAAPSASMDSQSAMQLNEFGRKPPPRR